MNLLQKCKPWAGIFVRGFCMGTADIIPGVSGGTIAFISGIYMRLLNAIGMFVSPLLIGDLLRLQISSAWRRADCGFLMVLFSGILCAVFSLSKVLHYLLLHHTHLLLAFFCGLVLAAAFFVARQIAAPKPKHLIIGFVGALCGLAVVFYPAAEITPSLPVFFFGGAIAICAMLLPGISGSYILLILGLYGEVLNAVHERQILTLVVFAAGCGCGLLSFARLLSFLMKRIGDSMTAFLIGVMLGAMPKLWPWKESGGEKIILQPNVLPADFAGDAQVFWAILLLILGGILTAAVATMANKRT
ncbi:MAG: DUF368 domain-containing protein [Gammaproteobacteria bacterium WSBS_2016_MAG_OTU1]